MPLLLGALLLAVSGSPLPPQAQDADYWALVRDYRGSVRGVRERVAAMPQDSVRAAVNRARELPAERWPDVRAAGVMHTEAWYRAVISDDASASFHVEQAEQLIEVVVRMAPEQASFAARWAEVMTGLHRELRQPAAAKLFAMHVTRYHEVSRARIEALPHYRQGLDFEYRASTRGRPLDTTAMGLRGDADEADVRWWSATASHYERALAADPGLHAAALRLGRVRMLQRNTTEAAGLFARAERSDDPREAHLALLFGGSLAERDSQFDAAEAKYREALLRYPTGQAAPLALSQLLSRADREPESRGVLAEALDPAHGRHVEPLWTYLRPPRVDRALLSAMLDELRVEVLR